MFFVLFEGVYSVKKYLEMFVQLTKEKLFLIVFSWTESYIFWTGWHSLWRDAWTLMV